MSGDFKLPPDREAEIVAKLETFCKKFIGVTDHRIALITSGGTTVPLEKKTVRFIDNFSAGTRGAASAERFLKHGYALIFLHRQNSLKPFDRKLQNLSPAGIISALSVSKDSESPKITLDTAPETEQSIMNAVEEFQAVNNEGRLLLLPFVTLTEYLALLRLCSVQLARFKKRAVLYLAAAVSDFYIPDNQLAENKIQSSGGPLNLELCLVPKQLKPLINCIVPNAFVISFKLETDETILVKKARAALENYGHQLVVANILERRKQEVILVSSSCEEFVVQDSHTKEEIELPLVAKHTDFLIS